MDSEPISPAKNHPEGIHYWAKLESHSSTMAAELLRDTQINQQPRKVRRRQIALGLTIYVLLAISFIALCLSLGPQPSQDGSAPTTRDALIVPKY